MTTTITRDQIIDQMLARSIEIGQDDESGPYYTAWANDNDVNRETQPGDYDYIIQPAIDAGLDRDDAGELFCKEKMHREICRAAREAFPNYKAEEC
jgi:hypothetical protein